MVRVFTLIIYLCSIVSASAQQVVDPADLVITAVLENGEVAPYQQEMVLLTIHGVYRRHLTLEKLENPDFGDINWMQLGLDHWYDSTLNGVKVKNMRRRMALFPDKSGRLEIGPFIHHLTLLDEKNKWFEYDIKSKPIVLQVKPAPKTDGWWFPVRRLEISDRWSNPPDQLGEGEGVLRVITLKAIGVAPDMIPPMPEMKSPSAHIFAHPDKRRVELSPHGPVSRAYWRWTIMPKANSSAILEPIEFTYFDTVERVSRKVTISAQRVAQTVVTTSSAKVVEVTPPAILRSGFLSLSMFVAFLAGLGVFFGRDRAMSFDGIREIRTRLKLKQELWWGVRSKNQAQIRHAAMALDGRSKQSSERRLLLRSLDEEIYAMPTKQFDYKSFYNKFTSTLS